MAELLLAFFVCNVHQQFNNVTIQQFYLCFLSRFNTRLMPEVFAIGL